MDLDMLDASRISASWYHALRREDNGLLSTDELMDMACPRIPGQSTASIRTNIIGTSNDWYYKVKNPFAKEEKGRLVQKQPHHND